MNQIEKKRVLLVDDDEHSIRIFRKHLHARNYEIVGEAKDCQQAIRLLKSEKPDLTLLDFEMLSATGIGILEEIMAQNPDAMVIMLNGRGDIATMKECLDLGAYHYIRKDYQLETIFSVIDDSLKNFAEVES